MSVGQHLSMVQPAWFEAIYQLSSSICRCGIDNTPVTGGKAFVVNPALRLLSLPQPAKVRLAAIGFVGSPTGHGRLPPFLAIRILR
jgi:hypothetical protein